MAVGNREEIDVQINSRQSQGTIMKIPHCWWQLSNMVARI